MRFVVIGGVAVGAHGHPRATRDLDVVPDPTPENITLLADVIADLRGTLVGVDAERLGIDLDAATIGEGANFPLDTIYGRLDVLQEIGDNKLYDEVGADAIEVEIDGILVKICSLQSLRRLKQAAGRPQDIADLAALENADSD